MFNSPLLRVLAVVVLLLPFTWATAEHMDQRDMLGKARSLALGSEPGAARSAFQRRARFFPDTSSLRFWLTRHRSEYQPGPLPEGRAWVTVTCADLVILLRYDAGRLAERSEVWRRAAEGRAAGGQDPRPLGPAGS